MNDLDFGRGLLWGFGSLLCFCEDFVRRLLRPPPGAAFYHCPSKSAWACLSSKQKTLTPACRLFGKIQAVPLLCCSTSVLP